MVATTDTLGQAHDSENGGYGHYISDQAMLFATTALTDIGSLSLTASTHDDDEINLQSGQDLSGYQRLYLQANKVSKGVEDEIKASIDAVLDAVPDMSKYQKTLKVKQSAADEALTELRNHENDVQEALMKASSLGDSINDAKRKGHQEKLTEIDEKIESLSTSITENRVKLEGLGALDHRGGLAFTVADIINNSIKAFKEQAERNRDSMEAAIMVEMSKLDSIGDEGLKTEIQKFVMTEIAKHINHTKPVTEKQVTKQVSAIIRDESIAVTKLLDDLSMDKLTQEANKFVLINAGAEKYSDPSIASKESELKFVSSILENSEARFEELENRVASSKKALAEFEQKAEEGKRLSKAAESLSEAYITFEAQLAKSPTLIMVNPRAASPMPDLQLEHTEDNVKFARGELGRLIADTTLDDSELSSVIKVMIFLDQLVGAKYLLTKALGQNETDCSSLSDQTRNLAKAAQHMEFFIAKMRLLNKFTTDNGITIPSQELFSKVQEQTKSCLDELKVAHASVSERYNSLDAVKTTLEAELGGIYDESDKISEQFKGYISGDTPEELLQSHIGLLKAMTLALEEFRMSDDGIHVDERNYDPIETTSFSEQVKADLDDESGFESADPDGDGLTSPNGSTSSLEALDMNYSSLEAELSDAGFDPEQMKKAKIVRAPSPVLQAIAAAQAAPDTDDEGDGKKEEQKVRKFKKKIRPRHTRTDSQSFSHAQWQALLPELAARADLPAGDYGADADDEDDDPIVIDTPRVTKVRFAEGADLEQIRFITDPPVELPEATVTRVNLADKIDAKTNDAVAALDSTASPLPKAEVKVAKVAEVQARASDAVAILESPAVSLPKVEVKVAHLPIEVPTKVNDLEVRTIEALIHDDTAQTDFAEQIEVTPEVEVDTDIAQLMNTQSATITPLNAIVADGSEIQTDVEIDEEIDVNNRHIAANGDVGMIHVNLSGIRDSHLERNMPVPEASHMNPEIERMMNHMHRVDAASSNDGSKAANDFAGKVFTNMADEGVRLDQKVPLGKVDAADARDLMDKDEIFSKVLDYLRRQRRTAGLLPDIILPPAA